MDMQALVHALGIDKMPEEQQGPLLDTIYDTLQKRVALRMSELLTDERAEEFERLGNQDDDASADELERQFPEFRQVYLEECTALLDDYKMLTGRERAV
jgi:hypothetical protein